MSQLHDRRDHHVNLDRDRGLGRDHFLLRVRSRHDRHVLVIVSTVRHCAHVIEQGELEVWCEGPGEEHTKFGPGVQCTEKGEALEAPCNHKKGKVAEVVDDRHREVGKRSCALSG